MSEREFVYWLQGYLEISGSNELSPTQVQIIKDHISLVLKKQTPNYGITVQPAIGPYLGGGAIEFCQGHSGCQCSKCKPLIAVC